MELIFLAHGLNIESISHYLAHGLVVGWAINRESPVVGGKSKICMRYKQRLKTGRKLRHRFKSKIGDALVK